MKCFRVAQRAKAENRNNYHSNFLSFAVIFSHQIYVSGMVLSVALCVKIMQSTYAFSYYIEELNGQ